MLQLSPDSCAHHNRVTTVEEDFDTPCDGLGIVRNDTGCVGKFAFVVRLSFLACCLTAWFVFLLCLQTSNKDSPKTPYRLFQRLLCLFSRNAQIPDPFVTLLPFDFLLVQTLEPASSPN